MADLMDFDRLNAIKSPKDYFSGMDISNNQYEDRMSFFEEYKDIMLFMFSYISESIKYGASLEYLKPILYAKIIDLVGKYGNIDSYLQNQTHSIIDNLIRVTMENIDKEYYTSNDRALFVALDQSNTVLNHMDYVKAKNEGRTRKIWLDIKDNRTRQSHMDVGGTELKIDELFVVGDSLMLYPKDESNGAGAEEIVNCRCSILYF